VPEDERTPTPDVNALVDGLRATVEQRRRDGRYPPGLEEDLDAHFHRIVTHRVVPDLSALEAAVSRLESLPGVSVGRIPAESTLPGGAALHRAMSRALGRQLQGVLEQVEEVSSALKTVVTELASALRLPNTHFHPDLVGQVDALQERMAALERGPLDSPAALADLGRRVEALEAAEAARRFRPWFSNDAFESQFRGSADDLKSRYADLAARFDGCSPVLDVGCGRGEFMELLAERGLEVRGVELDRALVEAAVARGLAVSHGDGLEALGEAADGSLGGIALIQVAEHLSQQQLVNLVLLAFDKLRPGGRIVLETVNPQSLYVFARAFYLDPTHDRPVHPAYLTFLFRQAGFAGVEIDWRSPPPGEEILQLTGEARHDANVERLNRLLFAPQDYALIATR